jgi:thiol:disulfide interchange protein DsbC
MGSGAEYIGCMENQRVRSRQRFAGGWLPLLVMLGASSMAGAAGPPDVAAVIRKNLESRFPGAHVLDVSPAEVPGLYEVYLGDQIVYSDAAANYILVGQMIDTQSKSNLTEARMDDHAKIDFNSLPLQQAIKIVKGDGSRKFAVFSDPDCPYCRQLEQTLVAIDNYTMYVFLYPIATLHPQAPSKAHAIWCAPDRAQAWNQWMHEKKLPPAKSCSGDPVDALQQLGDKLRVNSTPTMYMANGRRIAGAIPLAELEKAISSGGATIARGPALAPAAK